MAKGLRVAWERTVQENCKVDFSEPRVVFVRTTASHHSLEGSLMSAASSLLEVFSRLDDPRKARGVRHPFPVSFL